MLDIAGVVGVQVSDRELQNVCKKLDDTKRKFALTMEIGVDLE